MVKYIRDALYEGFIVVEDEELNIISTYEFQRLRRISHLGLASYIYPSATHTRFSHSLGVMHLMKLALESIEKKHENIDETLRKSAVLSALMHDLGHAPLSHALEKVLLEVDHEEITKRIILERFGGIISDEIRELIVSIYEGKSGYPFLEELVSGQLDVDRMDYLRRDALFCGVNYGLIDVSRIVHTLTLVDNHLAVEEKGKYAVEGYLVARYLMYWSVYYHKTNLALQAMLSSLFTRAKELFMEGMDIPLTDNLLKVMKKTEDYLDAFVKLDDAEIFYLFKLWMDAKDPILSDLSRRILSRDTFKTLDAESLGVMEISRISEELERLGFPQKYYLVERLAVDTAYEPYNPDDGRIIRILRKDGSWVEITKVLPTDTLKALSREVRKRYIFVPREVMHVLGNR